jgi:hypothetical protein
MAVTIENPTGIQTTVYRIKKMSTIFFLPFNFRLLNFQSGIGAKAQVPNI